MGAPPHGRETTESLQQVTAQLLPPDIFETEMQAAAVLPIQTLQNIGGKTVVLREGSTNVAVYDEAGKLVPNVFGAQQPAGFIKPSDIRDMNLTSLITNSVCIIPAPVGSPNYIAVDQLLAGTGIKSDSFFRLSVQQQKALGHMLNGIAGSEKVTPQTLRGKLSMANLDSHVLGSRIEQSSYFDPITGTIVSFYGEHNLIYQMTVVLTNGDPNPANWVVNRFENKKELESIATDVATPKAAYEASRAGGIIVADTQRCRVVRKSETNQVLFRNKSSAGGERVWPCINGGCHRIGKTDLFSVLSESNRLELVDTSDGVTPDHWTVESITLPEPTTDVVVHPKGTYAVYVNNIGVLKIFDLDSKSITQEIASDPAFASHPIVIENSGAILVPDRSNHPRRIITNLNKLWAREDITQRKRDLKLLDGAPLEVATADAPDDGSSAPEDPFVAEIVGHQTRISDHYKPSISAAITTEQVMAIHADLSRVESAYLVRGISPDLVTRVLLPTRTELFAKETEIAQRELTATVARVRARIREDIEDSDLQLLEECRLEIKGAIDRASALRLEIDGDTYRLRRNINTEIGRQWNERRDSLVAELEDLKDALVEDIQAIDESEVLQSFKDRNPKYSELLQRLDISRRHIGSDTVGSMKRSIADALKARRIDLHSQELEEDRKREEERQACLSEIDREISDLDSEMQDAVGDEFAYQRFITTSGTLIRLRASITAISDASDRSDKELSLDRVLTRHRSRVQGADSLRETSDGRHALFGAERFPISQGTQEVKHEEWAIGFDVRHHDPKNEARDELSVYFVGPAGRKVYVREALQELSADLEQRFGPAARQIPETIARRDLNSCLGMENFYLNVLRRMLSETDGSHAAYRIPHVPDEIACTQEVVGSLEQLARLSKMQLGLDRDGRKRKNPQGMIILEGDTGTGKDIILDIFAERTKRPLFVFDCSKWTQRSEFSYTYEFDGRTIRVDSEVRKALRTPGAILYFNEFNQLDQAAQKYLNSLLSHRRQIAGAFNGDSETEKDVLIVGSMNGRQGYHGVAIETSAASRIRFMEVDYLQERSQIWACDNEVTTAARRLTPIRDLTPTDLTLLWNYVVNRQSTSAEKTRLASLATPERVAAIGLIRNSLKDQNKLSDTNWRYHHSEAYVMAKVCGEFNTLREDQFQALWDKIINGIESDEANDLETIERRKLIIAFKLVIQVLNNIRTQFRKTHNGEDIDEGKEVRFIGSTREAVECAKEIDYNSALVLGGEDLAMAALSAVILPKIPRPAERKYIQTLFSQGVTTKIV